MKKAFFYYWIPFFCCAGIFIFIKSQAVGVRFSDTNIYFYTAKELLAGKILYKDIFFTNFPLIPYIAAIYYVISGGNLMFYYFTAVIESLVASSIIYYLALKQTSSRLIATTSIVLYLLSFMLLTTSDHQTGVFLASLFSVISYLFFTRKNYLLVGVFTALALLTKAYTLPLCTSYLIFLTVNNPKGLIRYCLGGIVTAMVILSPSFLFAAHDLFRDVFAYSLTRSEGVGKLGIIYFIFQHDFIFTLLLVASAILFKKKSFFSYFSVLSIGFLLFYKDVYYLYLNVTLAIIVIIYPTLQERIAHKLSLNRFLLPSIIFFFTIYNIFSYFNGYSDLQIIPDHDLSSLVKEHNPPVIYGVNDLAPLISYETNIPLMNGIIDTNDNIFRKGYLNATTLTQQAISQHAMVVVNGAYYPAQQVTEDILTEIVDKKLLLSHCQLTKRIPFHSEGITNSINVFSC